MYQCESTSPECNKYCCTCMKVHFLEVTHNKSKLWKHNTALECFVQHNYANIGYLIKSECLSCERYLVFPVHCINKQPGYVNTDAYQSSSL